MIKEIQADDISNIASLSEYRHRRRSRLNKVDLNTVSKIWQQKTENAVLGGENEFPRKVDTLDKET